MSVSPLQGEVLVNTGIEAPDNCTISLGSGFALSFSGHINGSCDFTYFHGELPTNLKITHDQYSI